MKRTNVILMLPSSHKPGSHGMVRARFENAEALAAYLTTPDHVVMRRSIFIDKKEYKVYAHSIHIDTSDETVTISITMRDIE